MSREFSLLHSEGNRQIPGSFHPQIQLHLVLLGNLESHYNEVSYIGILICCTKSYQKAVKGSNNYIHICSTPSRKNCQLCNILN